MTAITERSVSRWRESLQPRLSEFLMQLKVKHWDQLRSMQVDSTTRELIASLCADMISIMAALICEAMNEFQASGKSPDYNVLRRQEQGRPQSNTQVHDVLLNMFVDEDSISPEMRCKSTEEVYRLVHLEVEDRVDSKLDEAVKGKRSSSSKTKELPVSQKFKGRLKTIVRHVVQVLNRYVCCSASSPQCRSKSSSTEPFTSPEASKAQKASKSPEASSSLEASTSLDMSLSDKPTSDEEPQQIPAAPAEQGDQETSKGWQIMATEAVRLAVEELFQEIHTMGPLDGFSVEERALIQSSVSDDSSLRASDIVQVAMEELKSETEARTCWQRTTRWFQSFCANRFAKNSILSFVSELKKKYRREEPCEDSRTPLSELMDGVDQLLDDIVPLESSQGELYEDMFQNVSGEKEQVVSEQLNDLVSHHIGPDPDSKLDFESDLQTSVDSFLQRLKRWLRQQVLLTKSGRDSATEALQKVQDVMLSTPATSEASSPQEGDSEGAVSEAEVASCSFWPTGPEPAATAAVAASPEPAAAASPKPAAAAALPEPAAAASPKPAAAASAKPAAAAASPEPAAAESPKPAAAAESPEPAAVALPKPAAADALPEPMAETKTSQGWETHDYKVLVMTLVDSITKKARSWMLKNKPELIAALTQKLCAAMADCDVSVKPTERHLKRITKAVKRDLVKQWENDNMVQNYLLICDDDTNQVIVDSMKKHLVAPKKKSFCSRVFSFCSRKK
ncbi:uncharacterized protein V6R79_025552 [Siganus canaliculatus]